MDPLGEWQQAAELKYHSGSVHKLSWAHPEFGQVNHPIVVATITCPRVNDGQ
jgi:hypothetical protein